MKRNKAEQKRMKKKLKRSNKRRANKLTDRKARVRDRFYRGL